MGHAVTARKKQEDFGHNADPFLVYSVPQTPSGAHKAGLRGEWDSFRSESTPGRFDWLYFLLFFIAVGAMGYFLLQFMSLI